MKISAAVVDGPDQPWHVEELVLAEPRGDEVLVRIVATGVCHTDVAVRQNQIPHPMVSCAVIGWGHSLSAR